MNHPPFGVGLLVLGTLVLAVALPAGQASNLPSGFRESLVASGIQNPTAMAFAPDGRLFVCEQGGRLRVVKNGSLLSTPFVTLDVSSSGERGLLGVAFDPDFGSNHYVYVYYTTTTPTTHNRVSRFTASGDVAAGSETPIFDLDDLSAVNHNGGAIHFGPDGALYIAAGDNANSANAQSLSTVLGKILRINADGSIPADNPFYDSTNGTNRAIWALGLRNPFTFAFNPQGGRMFINDVGEVSREEINDGGAGTNYGWPDTEGPTSDPRFVAPSHAYGRSDGCSIVGGAFYAPAASQFPAEYYGDYFFADYCGWWIRRMNPSSGSVTSFATGIPVPVDLKVSSDGALYYLARGSGSNTGAVYKIEYGSGATPPSITMHPSSQTAPPGGSATFSVAASGQQPLQYQWQRNGANISGATSPDYSIAPVAQPDNGARFQAVVSNGAGSATSSEAVLTITSDSAPMGTITQPVSSTSYTAGSAISYAATATDAEDGTLPPGAFTWQVDFHHDTHSHPFIQPTSGSTSGSFTVPTTGHTEPNVWFRIHLTVRDSAGLTHQTYREVYPLTSQLTLASNPAGLGLKLDGQPTPTPIGVDSVVGVIRSLEAPTPVTAGGITYEFVSWSDGGAAGHDISTPASNTTYTATYRVSGGVATPIRIDFHPAAAPTHPGYLADTGLVFGDRGNGQTYGWNADNAGQTRNRNNPISPDQRYDTFVFMQRPENPNAFWEIAVPNGTYTVYVVGGDPTSVDGNTQIEVEGVLTASGMPSTADLWIEGTSTVTVSDGRLTIRSAAGGSVNKLSFVDITPLAGGGGGTPAPALSTLSPASGPVGTAVTISGANFGTTQGASSLTFNGTVATPTNWTAASISALVPGGATTGPVVVTARGQASNGVSFTVTTTAPPSEPGVANVSPLSGPTGTAVTISGANFGTTQGASGVTFNGTPATATSWSTTRLAVVVPAGATSGTVVVTVSGRASNGITFSVSTGGGTLSAGRIGWWGPFQSGLAPNNRVPGMPNGVFVGNPTFTSDGGGAFSSTATDYLHVADGGAGGTYDWTSGAWSVQVDFTLPATVSWNGYDHLLLVSKGSFNHGTGWEVQLNDSMFRGKYQFMLEMNKGVNVYRNATAYVVTPGAYNRALFVCDTAGVGRWYVNGTASHTMPCWAPQSGATDLTIGRYSAEPAYPTSFPITRVQIWNRALTATEAAQSTTTDPE